MNQATMADVMDVEIAEAAPIALPAVQQVSQKPMTSTSASLMTIIEVCISRPDFDIDKVQRLLEVKERWDAIESRKAFVEGMAAFKREPIEIYKRKQVGYKAKDGKFVGYKHAELSDVTDAIAPAMAKHGLSFDWDIHQTGDTITVDCVVTHAMGHSKKVTMSGPLDKTGNKNAIQQAGSTITYLQRYTLLAATGMSTKDEDNDGADGADGQPDDQQTHRANERPTARASQSQPEHYDQQKFDLNKAQWRDLILSGKKTVDQIVRVIESKGARLTEEQKLTLDSYSHEKD